MSRSHEKVKKMMNWYEFSEEAMSHMSLRLTNDVKIVSPENIRAYMDEVFVGIMCEFLANLKDDILKERNNIIDEAIGDLLHGKEDVNETRTE